MYAVHRVCAHVTTILSNPHQNSQSKLREKKQFPLKILCTHTHLRLHPDHGGMARSNPINTSFYLTTQTDKIFCLNIVRDDSTWRTRV